MAVDDMAVVLHGFTPGERDRQQEAKNHLANTKCGTHRSFQQHDGHIFKPYKNCFIISVSLPQVHPFYNYGLTSGS